MNLKKITSKIISILIIICLIIIFQKPVIRSLKRHEHLQLQYENIDYVEILFYNKSGIVKIDDRIAIEKLISYLNGFELVNEENNSEKETVAIYLFGNMAPTAISFSENHLNFSDSECWECIYTEYYIVDSNFSETYKFLNELVNEYVKDDSEY